MVRNLQILLGVLCMSIAICLLMLLLRFFEPLHAPNGHVLTDLEKQILAKKAFLLERRSKLRERRHK